MNIIGENRNLEQCLNISHNGWFILHFTVNFSLSFSLTIKLGRKPYVYIESVNHAVSANILLMLFMFLFQGNRTCPICRGDASQYFYNSSSPSSSEWARRFCFVEIVFSLNHQFFIITLQKSTISCLLKTWNTSFQRATSLTIFL